MSYVLVSAEDIHYGPTSLSTEDSALHQQISDLTISNKVKRSGKSDRKERIKAKLESKMKELKDKPERAEELREKMEKLVLREEEQVAVIDGKKVKFDPSGKSIVIKVEDSPVRVLNKLAALGYQITPSSSGSGGSRVGHVWTLFRPGYVPQPIYPELKKMNNYDLNITN